MSIMILFSTLVYETTFGQTTMTICTNDPVIYKLDLRDYINQLGPYRTISDIDPLDLCNLVQKYDYVWLTQIWTPSQYNFQNNINPTQSSDYRITKNIKEYVLDPVLGTSQDLIQLKRSLNQICYHTKFLGEFSFYIGKDSSLIQNSTRFLTIPFDQISRFYNPRYDKEGFIWAIDDFGRTIPNSAVWNLFSQTVITDIKDIIYRQILMQYNFDGIVFLQPSLGLYSFNIKFYSPEVSYFGQIGYLQDFYVNFGLKNLAYGPMFIGGEDNLNSGQILLNQGLQIIYPGPTRNYDRTWALVSNTFDQNGFTNSMTFSGRSVTRLSGTPRSVAIFVEQDLPQTQKSCFRLVPSVLSSACIGLGNKTFIVQKGYSIDMDAPGHGLFCIHDWKIFNAEDDNIDRKSVAFNFSASDQMEIQYDPLNKTVIFRKFQTNIKYQMQIQIEPSKLQYMVMMGGTASYYIQYPFKFSVVKSAAAQILDFKKLVAISTETNLQFAQILPNLNLLNTTTLNIQIKELPTSKIVGVGVCNQELMMMNQHAWDPTQIGGGAYMILSNGKTLNSEQSLNNIQTSFIYSKGDSIQITYVPGQRVEFYDNISLNHTVTVKKYIRNVNFCVAFTTIDSEFLLAF